MKHALLLAVLLFILGCTGGGPSDRFVVIEDSTTETVTARLIFGIEPYDLPAGTASTAALCLSEEESQAGGGYLVKLRSLGATFRATAEREALIIDFSAPKSAWDQTVGLVAEHISKPPLVVDEVRGRQHAALDSLRHNPEELARTVLFWQQCGGARNTTPATGSDSSIDSITTEHVKAFCDRVFIQQNYVLGMTGPIGKGDAQTCAATLDKNLPPGTPITTPPPPCPRPAGLNVRIIEIPGLQRSTVCVGIASEHLSKDSAAEVLGMAAALHAIPSASLEALDQILRVERGIVESIDIETSRVRAGGNGLELRADGLSRRDIFAVSAESDPVNALFVIKIILKELSDFNTAGLSEQEIVAMGKLIATADQSLGDSVTRMRAALAQKWLGVAANATGDSPIAVARARQMIRKIYDPRNLWVIAVVPDAEYVRVGILSGGTLYSYPPSVDQREIRRLDQEYLSFRPFWEAGKIEALKASDLFR